MLLRKKSPSIYGARRGKQWPRIAVRRYLLYDVLLREIGRNQIIDPKAKSIRRKYAQSRKSEEFASFWRKKLWSESFDHPDLVHNPPSKEELENLVKLERLGWKTEVVWECELKDMGGIQTRLEAFL